MRKTDEDSGSGWFDLAVVAPTAESRQSIRPISGQTLGTGALRGPTEPVRNALTSLNRIALYPNPPHTRKVTGSIPAGTTRRLSAPQGFAMGGVAGCDIVTELSHQFA